MQTDKNLSDISGQLGAEAEESDQEKSLRWLLDMDLSEPEEKLFTVADDEYLDTGLSAYEAEVAGRPLVRGNASSDDLASYVEEEIVVSSAGAGADIYNRNDAAESVQSARMVRDEFMAVDFSLGRPGEEAKFARHVEEGADILGLAGDDDIGEKFVSLKRVKPVADSSVVRAEGTVKAPLAESPRDEVAGPADAAATMPDSEASTEMAAPVEVAASLASDSAMEPMTPLELASLMAPVSPLEPGAAIESNAPIETVSAPSSVVRSEIRMDAAASDSVPHMDLDTAPPAAPQTVYGASDDLPDAGEFPSVSEYVATLPESMDDDEFDSYLLAGNHLPEGHSDPEDLVVHRDEGAVSVDPSSEVQIDYHEDFGAFGDSEHEPLAVAEAVEEVPSVSVLSAVEPTAAQEVAHTDSAPGEGFGEDIFADEFSDDFAALLSVDGSLASADIDAAFADLSPFQDSRDEICGVGFEDFETADVIEVGAEEAPESVEEELTAAEPASEDSAGIDDARDADTGEEVDLAAFDGTCLDSFVPDYITFNYSTQSNTEIFTDFLDAFIEEGTVEVERLENEVGEWERNVASEPLFASVSRTLHTLKGIAKGVGLQRLGTLVHNFETLLEKMPRPNSGEEQTYFRIVNAWLDAIVRGVEFVVEKRADVASELPVPIGKSASEQAEDTVSPSQDEVVARPQADERPLIEEVRTTAFSALEKKRDQQLADEGAKVLAAQQSVRITSEKLDHLLNLTSQAQQLGVRASQNTTRSKRSSAELQARLSSVRTHIRKIADRALLDVNARPGSSSSDMDALEMDQYSELQEAASILREGVEDLADLVDVVSRQNMQIETLLKQQSSVISGISSSIQGARVVPVSRLMPGLRRIVRTVSTDLGKIVTFKALNEIGALDRDHYARLQVILEHMVRNALDHGIETPDERMAMGKATGGRITIDVRKSGGDYVVRLADDGRGIDPDAIRESAYEKGLDVDVDALSDDEAIRLIFHKGFSTANTLSEISGRGVGMDIVLTELQQIGGDVQIQSAVGLGTAFEIRIPSNVSVNGALLVRAAGESYAIPLNGLVSVEQVPVDEFFAAVEEGTELSVADIECQANYLATLCQGVALPDRSVWGNTVPVIVAGTEDRYMAIAIDSLEEALELVVRSLGSQFSTVPGVAGAATTAEGEAIIALDLNLLVSTAGSDGIAPVAVSRTEPTTLLALVVDDSRTQRMVATSQLDTVGVETVTAENGLVAIDLLNATHRLPDVVLLDVEMPVKDGIQTLREIRKSQRYGHLPVIMVTSRTGAKHRALAGEAGCNGYMGKPFNFPELIRRINELTGHDLSLS
ncbi:Gliding motility regulatory protein [Halioglobus japonicus]|nr:Gliding motility regulatory protein [Halioglobus japonicus]